MGGFGVFGHGRRIVCALTRIDDIRRYLSRTTALAGPYVRVLLHQSGASATISGTTSHVLHEGAKWAASIMAAAMSERPIFILPDSEWVAGVALTVSMPATASVRIGERRMTYGSPEP
jgi:hypothetical protein